jgi:glycogen operon protein
VGEHDPVTLTSSTVLLGRGSADDLGLTRTDAGTNVAVHAPSASEVRVCVLDAEGVETSVALPGRTGGVWHGLLRELAVGTRYGLRAAGPYVPHLRLRFDPGVLVVDPYARAVSRHGSGWVGVVADEAFAWGDDTHPRRPWSSTVLYEAHVRGLTMRHPDVPERLRGTYAGLAHPAVTSELRRLGITAVELLPVHQFASEPGLVARGGANYWGYNTLAFFAPHGAYAAAGAEGGQVAEFKTMVKALHAAGIEVFLDVVYNHTADGGLDAPTLSLRGLDDDGYYLHPEGPHGSDGTRYFDVTGCGNTVRAESPVGSRLILDSLRYWVREMHVDGFRFDLASALARERLRVEADARLLRAIRRDPVLRDTKLVAEPWDATLEGYLVGRFPPGWCEWNDRYRDTVRDFWRTRPGGVRDLAYRLSGSSDLYADDGRHPSSSINFVTSHDGFTLRDLVSYETKHNEPNGEHNRDGHGDNRSWNCGVEGESSDPAVVALRQRQSANLLATLLLSTGVPMLTAGDERGRTQLGNNNAYCQDNETSWVDWTPAPQWAHLTDLTRDLLALRVDHRVLRQRRFLGGHVVDESGVKDLAWFHPHGREMSTSDWHDEHLHSLGMYLSGIEVGDISLLLLFHSGPDPVEWKLPAAPWAAAYEVLHDTSSTVTGRLESGAVPRLAERCVVVLGVEGPGQASRRDAATSSATRR